MIEKKFPPKTYQLMREITDNFLKFLVERGLLIMADDDMFETENGDSETVYSLSLLIANDLAETHEKDGTVEEFQEAILNYIYFNYPYSHYF